MFHNRYHIISKMKFSSWYHITMKETNLGHRQPTLKSCLNLMRYLFIIAEREFDISHQRKIKLKNIYNRLMNINKIYLFYKRYIYRLHQNWKLCCRGKMRLASEIRIQKCDRKNHIDNFNFLMIDDWIVSRNEMMCINLCWYRTFIK